ncbi:MAG: 4Fe-4S binding protein [Dehalococcoidales bacterium]
MLYDVAASSEKGMRTAVLLCEDLANLGTGLNLEELRSSLEANFPSIAVEVVPDLCGHLAQLSSVATRRGAAWAVLGLCSGDYSQIELQARARKAGLDPFGLEVVPLGTLCARVHPEPQATWKAKMLLGAAVARAQAFQGSGPEHAKLYFLPRDQKVTRRSLFTIPPVGYRPVPAIREQQCAAEAGCQFCIRVCPRDALQKIGGHISLDKSRCEGCGVCLAACPREAIDFPGWSLAQFEAQLAALLDSARLGHESFGFLFTCQRAVGKLEELARQGVSYCHQWLPVVVPCLGIVTPTWILQSLAYGTEVVALLFCGAGCPLGQGQIIGGRASFCRQLLRRLGQAPERVRVLNASHAERLLQALQEPPPRRESGHQRKTGDNLHLGTLKGAFQSIQCLAAAGHSSSEVVLEHSHSPFGVVELRAEGCTGCLACSEVCPTGALASERNGDGMTLTYLASSCTGCGMCFEVCPESAAQVLRVRSLTNLDILSRGKVVLHKNQFAICEGCGASIASQTLLRRIEASLEGSDEALQIALTRYCPSCRISFVWGAKFSSIQHGERT